MDDVVAESSFDCRDRDGNEFVATVRLGRPIQRVSKGDRSYIACPVSFEPLFPETEHGGEDSFQAICLAIELIRKAVRAFVAHGGAAFFRGTRTPIDAEDSSFCPISEPIYDRFMESSPSPEQSRGWPNSRDR